jgi:hypothetical protein
VRARLAGFLENRDRERLTALLFLKLRQAKRGGQAGGSAADDQDVDFERFTIQTIYPFSSSLVSAGAISKRSATMP